MTDINRARTSNPKAAAALEQMKDTMETLSKLRESGVAKGASPLRSPHSGRYEDVRVPTRQGSLRKSK